MNIKSWLNYAKTILMSESSYRDAEILLSHILGKSRTWLMAFNDHLLTFDQLIALDSILFRRAKGEPIAYLLGQREFWSLSFHVNNSTMIPRPDTEILVELSLLHMPSFPARLLDLGTGTGAIALAIKSERPDCIIIGIDIIKAAISLAQYNAIRLNLNAYFLQSNWFSKLPPGQFDVIVSNPPYIDINDPYLKKGDVRFEPPSALVAPEMGLMHLRYIINQSSNWLKSGGWLLLEHGWQQGKQVYNLFREQKYFDINTYEDYSGYNRVTLGRKY
ncbi:peptide chain release factor N(5)-glutamine methyltransferase [Candidatus Ishikawella capsulata]|uniref:Release factor glutamine methyltransferase n=1 Tax=Candidatus Ishikawaella capsulata Mpkobe TaxID=476281 RepID=C5WD71_9ENTR|nr:peptide chain release factor N(5)-glutamine methyltransferase [Candidatus Ishikawaella capsulata]BAH83277.1 N5-glutamine S-adenosyl-L-methionine-dependent methyltransferase [Candidatus Ishikawaella capsulata Mpkobe]